MTTDELCQVIDRHFAGVNSRLDKLNGKVERHEADITSLRVNAAYWAGGAVVAATVIGWLTR